MEDERTNQLINGIPENITDRVFPPSAGVNHTQQDAPTPHITVEDEPCPTKILYPTHLMPIFNMKQMIQLTNKQ